MILNEKKLPLEKNHSLWFKIKNLGVNHAPNEATSLYVLNQLGTFGGLGCILVAFISLFFNYPFIYFVLAMIYGLTAGMMPLLNYYNQINISKLITSFFHPILVCSYIIIFGGSFGEECILIASIFMIQLLYKESPKVKYALYFSGGISYTIAQIYISFFPPILNFANNAFDNYIAFIICSAWLIMIIYKNQEKENYQKGKREGLINELQTKNDSLKNTTEELEQFTYIASHDLKSPLRTIISFLDLIKRDITKEKYDALLEKLEFARSGAEQMNFLVTDILEYSKMTSGKKRKKSMVNLQSVAEKVKFNLMDLIKEKNVDLYIFPLPDFYCNETEMTILFQNFIENGIKYNEESTPNIFVKSNLNEQELTLQFVDNGIGIEETYFEKIFLFFKRLHTNEVYKGTGLGLGLCKKIIDNMNGSVAVESMMNVGSTFTIKLPVQHSKTPLKITRIPVEQDN